MKIFISWSGEKSKALAEALHEWLPNVIQGLEPWISASDIEKGAMWRTDIAQQLDTAAVGIICLTADNLDKPWILFEAGAISKKLDEAYVCTYLLDIEPSDVKDPLAQFQATKATKGDTQKLLQTINRAQKENMLPLDRIDRAFEKWWPDLEEKLKAVTGKEEKKESRRADRDILNEILLNVRYLVQKGQIIADSDTYVSGEVGNEIDAILEELKKQKQHLLITALEDGSLEYRNGILMISLPQDDTWAKRLRGATNIFKEIGMRLFGHPITAEIKITPNKRPAQVVNDSDIPF